MSKRKVGEILLLLAIMINFVRFAVTSDTTTGLLVIMLMQLYIADDDNRKRPPT